jgi:pyruvate/2-oxoglutarate dehydrogenase complex dihydrolipoamide acyltransferase (E2) component
MPMRWSTTMREPSQREPVLVPDLGDETPLLSLWIAAPGDHIYAGDRLVELLLDEMIIDVTAPITGRLTEKIANPGQQVAAKQILGWIETQ